MSIPSMCPNSSSIMGNGKFKYFLDKLFKLPSEIVWNVWNYLSWEERLFLLRQLEDRKHEFLIQSLSVLPSNIPWNLRKETPPKLIASTARHLHIHDSSTTCLEKLGSFLRLSQVAVYDTISKRHARFLIKKLSQKEQRILVHADDPQIVKTLHYALVREKKKSTNCSVELTQIALQLLPEDESSKEDVSDTEQNNDLVNTSPGTVSIAKAIPRIYADYYDSPMIKANMVEEGLLKPRNNVLNTMICLPRALDKIVKKHQGYRELQDSMDDGGLLAHLPDRFLAVDTIVSENGKGLVECVLLNDTHWVFISHIEAYLRDGSGLDSCAHDKLEVYYEQPEGSVLISGQGYSKTTWAQIIIRWGYVEYVAMAGYYGERGSTKSRNAFCGCILSCEVAALFGPNKTFKVNTLMEPAKTVSHVRHLRNYCNSSAKFLWSFESRRFAEGGMLRSTHPLELAQKYRKANNTNNEELASHIMSIACGRKFESSQKEQALSIISRHKEVQPMLKFYKNRKANSFSNLKQILLNRTPSRGLSLALNILQRMDEHKADDDGIIILLSDNAFKKETMDLYKTTIAPAVKKFNQRNIESLQKS